jgi:hypothetical protein
VEDHAASIFKARRVFPTSHKILVGKPEGKRLLGKIGRRWKDNIRMTLK